MKTKNESETISAKEDDWRAALNEHARKCALVVLLTGVVANLAAIGFDYFFLHSIWIQLLYIRVPIFYIGIVVLLLLLNNKLNLDLSLIIFLIPLFLFLSYGASIIDHKGSLLLWNTGLLVSIVFIFTALIWKWYLVTLLSFISFASYLIFFLSLSSLEFASTMGNSGLVLFIAHFAVPVGAFFRTKNAKRIFAMKFQIESQKREIIQIEPGDEHLDSDALSYAERD